MRQATQLVQGMTKGIDVDDVDKLKDDQAENAALLNELDSALSSPIGQLYDEDVRLFVVVSISWL